MSLVLAGVELAVYTFEADTRGIVSHASFAKGRKAGGEAAGGDGDGGGGDGDGDSDDDDDDGDDGEGEGEGGGGEGGGGEGGGDLAATGLVDDASAHETADASSVAHRLVRVAWSLHMRSWPSYGPYVARWP